MKKQRTYNEGFAIAILGTLLFSTKAIWIKLCFRESNIDATTLLMLRMLLSLPFYVIVLTIWQLKKSTQKIATRTYWWAILMGCIGYYLSSLFDFIGLQYVSAGIERVILFIYPTLAILINYLVYKIRIDKRQWISILVTYIGIGIAYWGEIHQEAHASNFIFGSIMVLLCGITYAFYLVGTGRLIPKMGVSNYTSVAMLAATGGIFTHYLLTEPMNQIPIYMESHSPILWYVIALAFLATVIPSFLLSSGMSRIGSNDLAIVTSIGPVATLFQSNLILHEQYGLLQVLGTLLVILGVIMVKKKETPAKKLG